MKEIIKKLFIFIRLLLKRWILLVVYYGSLIGVIVTLGKLKIDIPSFIFWILAFIGLFWASFRIYLELLKEMPIPYGEQKPNLSIDLIEGNEYVFNLMDASRTVTTDSSVSYFIKQASIELKIRISNNSSMDLDIILIEPYYKTLGSNWDALSSFPPQEKTKNIEFPRRLKKTEILLCNVRNIIEPSILLNNAQFASRLAKMDKNITETELEIIVEARDLKGNIHKFSNKTKISTRQLIDLYLDKWQEDGESELLRLAHSK